MSTSVAFQGTIAAGPGTSGECSFPGALINIAVRGKHKVFDATTVNSKSISSPSSYTTVDGIGTGQTVTKATFLYLKTNGKMLIEMTTQPDSGSDVVAVVPLHGTLILEFPDANYLKLLRVQGVGIIEYLAAGAE